jgi:hypothetical protein
MDIYGFRESKLNSPQCTANEKIKLMDNLQTW